MRNTYRISLTLLLKLSKTKKTFICFNLDQDKITDFVLTNDLIRFRNKYNRFKLVEIIKHNIKNLTIEI